MPTGGCKTLLLAPSKSRVPVDLLAAARFCFVDLARGGVRVNDVTVHAHGLNGDDDVLAHVGKVATGEGEFTILAPGFAPYIKLDDFVASNPLPSLAKFEADIRGPANNGSKFRSDWRRLESAVKMRSTLVDPSFDVLPFQLPKPFSFEARDVPEERALRAPAMAAVRNMSKLVGTDAHIASEYANAIDMGDHTEHNPDTLHPRFLEYVKERVRVAPPEIDRALAVAKKVLHKVWKMKGVDIKARPMTDVQPEELVRILNPGGAGEYAHTGATGRTDKPMVAMLSLALGRYSAAAHAARRSQRRPRWINLTESPVKSFGKTEAKRAKMINGERQRPIPRFIFNPSPVNYAMGAFLHSDISKWLMKNDPTHGPGFGPGRGKDIKFRSMVERAFGRETVLVDDEAVMSDIQKWDASCTEALLIPSIDCLEEAVDKTGLTPDDILSRRAMFDASKRQLLSKIVEHPSGYLVRLYGAMPSGSVYTSLINTIGNDLLAIGCMVRQLMRKGENPENFIDLLAEQVSQWLMSYGDNQLFFTRMFTNLGLKYDILDHADFLNKLGMKLKADETEVTKLLSRVRFCSRGMLMTPAGPIITRTHTAVLAKLAGRPTANPLDDKLYVRAMMADYLGTDPIAFEILRAVDEGINVLPTAKNLSTTGKKIVESAAKAIFGSKSDYDVNQIMDLVSRTVLDRRTLLSLHTAREDVDTNKQLRIGDALSLGMSAPAAPLDPRADFMSRMNPGSFMEFLRSTNQTGIMYD